MYMTLIVAEEPRSKIKTFLIAPNFSNIKVGDTVKSSNLDFKVLFAADFKKKDDVTYMALAAALGDPEKVTAVMEAVSWEEDEE